MAFRCGRGHCPTCAAGCTATYQPLSPSAPQHCSQSPCAKEVAAGSPRTAWPARHGKARHDPCVPDALRSVRGVARPPGRPGNRWQHQPRPAPPTESGQTPCNTGPGPPRPPRHATPRGQRCIPRPTFSIPHPGRTCGAPRSASRWPAARTARTGFVAGSAGSPPGGQMGPPTPQSWPRTTSETTGSTIKGK